MKSLWMNLAVEDMAKASSFYEALGFTIASYGDIKSVTLPEGGNIILFQKEVFKTRVPFDLATQVAMKF